ncbi:unnamed protein product [Acanthoscelides obtectus]|uniref:pyridoxal 5'-phosphate synthase n=1 Tax=Acanthoscelides obtectus TaxID=200917 RepID=A0A9P0KAY9_ACAOB|nr:unnamed protein product [Acanthoscelides obtectus]CAK1626788.1 Pyridoxine/pyridoxamine 5'-phosphate oxidase [Acanthoscelides obtectus]
MSKEESGLAHIDVEKGLSPIDLVEEWMKEYQEYSHTNKVLLNLATASREGEVSNRNVVLRELSDDGFTFLTVKNGKKVQHMTENPNVSACIYFSYIKDGKHVERQVRVEGVAEKLNKEKCKDYYEREPVYAKIRSIICDQGEKIEWDDLKKKHDEILRKYKEGAVGLEMPEHVVAYLIRPQKLDLYYAYDNFIADRIVFFKDKNAEWKLERVAT